MRFVWIGLFGVTGVFSRYAMDVFFARFAFSIPVGTLGVNVLGSFLAGIVYVLGTERSVLSQDLRLGLLVGFLGGFTTFSAYALQSMRLLEERTTGPAILYLVISPILGVLACSGGLQIARTLFSGR